MNDFQPVIGSVLSRSFPLHASFMLNASHRKKRVWAIQLNVQEQVMINHRS